MNSSLAVKAGVPPTLWTGPSDALDPNPDDVELLGAVLAACGLVLDDWQWDFLVSAIRPRSRGRKFAAFEVAGVVPRQNGKGAVMEARQLAGLFVFGERLQIHTAHEFKTAYEHFLRLKQLVEGSDELFKHVRTIRTGAGDQAIELRNGCRIRFLARSRTSIRGFSADAIYLDEAFELPSRVVGSILPAMSARPNPQVWYFSSAPHFTSDFLHSLLKRADAGTDPRLLLAAWESPADTKLDDVEAWRRANPALGIRIDEDFIANELRALAGTPEGVAEFSRERLGVREGGDGEAGVVPFAKWGELVDPKTESVSPPCYGLSVSPDGAWASFASAGRRRDGALHVTTVDRREGTAWVVARAVELFEKRKSPLRLNPAAAEGAFIRQLVDAGVTVIEVDARSYQQACGAFLEAVVNGKLRHLGQESMDRSVAAAGRRDVGKEGGWVWARPGAVDISPLTAVTLALTGVAQAKRVVDSVW